jgi:hypothetical protein
LRERRRKEGRMERKKTTLAWVVEVENTMIYIFWLLLSSTPS